MLTNVTQVVFGFVILATSLMFGLMLIGVPVGSISLFFGSLFITFWAMLLVVAAVKSMLDSKFDVITQEESEDE